MDRNNNEYLTERIHKQGCRIIQLEAENTRLRDLLKRALPYITYEDMQVANHGGTCTSHAQLAEAIKQEISPPPEEV